ncbi:hypothetical protein L2U69_14495 [Zavarzinia compransoris]|uniref:hypothetical protein n=1 Tax=Zavarzinia marina TaxID=2911065 RepID=UPI001F46EF8D|nr:hypothetical protein [Zavarzinia marina]MCF4166859.1 hypothetical protein [Zavarzinia marina]
MSASSKALLIGSAFLLLAACARHGAPRQDGPPAPPPGGLINMDADALPTYLGEPSLRRRESAWEIWQYAAPECLLYVFLFGPDGGQTVRHVDARDRQREPYDVATCVRRVGVAAYSRPEAVNIMRQFRRSFFP